MNWKGKEDKYSLLDKQCLVIYNGHYCLLYWNSTYKCWDDAEGDDHFCEKDEIDKWITIEEIVKSIN